MQEAPLFGLKEHIEVANQWLELLVEDPKEAPEAMRTEWVYLVNGHPFFKKVPVPPRYIRWDIAVLKEYGTLDALDDIAKGILE